MVGIAMDSPERDRFGKCLVKELVSQIPDLFVRSRDIKREYYPIMGPYTFSSLVVLKRREVILTFCIFSLRVSLS